MKARIITILSNGPAGFWTIMAAMPEETAVDVAEALRQLRTRRLIHKLAGTWRKGPRPAAALLRLAAQSRKKSAITAHWDTAEQ